MNIQRNLFDSDIQKSIRPPECSRPAKYIFETTSENKGDYIRREIYIIDKDGDLGVQFGMTGNFIKVEFFRKDCRITLIES